MGTAVSALAPGEVIPGTRYRVLEKVAEGAMGAVYAAEHVDLEKRVALKTLLTENAHTPQAVERFRQEAKAASRIGSPFICDVTDFGSLPDGQVFFVMEYLEGQSLATLIDAEGGLPPARTIGILRQVCKALGAGHEKGIIHLDVKPDNVMLVNSRQRSDGVKVVDFGVAGLIDQSKSEDRIAGTPEYIAPERALGRGYDHRCDIYSVGVVAYEMLTGSPPFQGKELLETLKKQVYEQPEPMNKRAPDRNIPAAMESLVMQLLAKDPAQRPQRMEVVEAMLCEAQIALGVHTEWDHLDLPPVDEVWQKKLAERMPSARGAARKKMLVAATSVALVAGAAAIYFGAIRAPEIKFVQVAVTETAEAESVAMWLEKADRAAREGHYSKPDTESALFFIRAAEDEAKKLGRASPGAGRLRVAYAGALSVIGNELLKAGLRELAVVKFKEALRFAPSDAALAAKAELSVEERGALADPERARRAPVKPANPEDRARDEARALAADLFAAARGRRISEARLLASKLRQADREGTVKARMADALRNLASGDWDRGDRKSARALYQLVLDLDPADLEAQARVRLELAAPPVAAVAAPVAAPVPVVTATTPERNDKRGRGRDKPSAEAPPEGGGAVNEAARDSGAAAEAVRAGEAALRAGRLADAESAFNRGVRADAQSAAAVGGLAQVAFERAQYPNALDYARRAAKLAPGSATYQLVLGDAYFKLLRYADAQSAYEKASSLGKGKDAQVNARLERVKLKLAP